ncbi:MAG: lipoyl(octanoyl) transferase LipB [Alphaproteobacteria bacterium]|nr:lipoyl(octanoyl) transferase LipB [Alphaproteobacteria bacterium]
MTIEWWMDHGVIPFDAAEAFMKDRVHAIQKGQALECVWLLQHPPLYTAGTSAKEKDLLDHGTSFPIYHIGRGGQYTYHGPGQRICYVMLDLKKRGKDVRKHVQFLEQWGIETLAMCGIDAFQSEAGVGLWVNLSNSGDNIAKIAAIGVRVSRWVTSYGIAFNVNPNLDHYKGIVPCGINQHGITSLHAMDKLVAMDTFDRYLKMCFEKVTSS